MGNQSSFQQHHDFKDIATNYDYQRKFNDKRFGEIKLYKEKGTDKKIFQKDLSLNSPQEFEEQVNRVRDASALAHANLLQTYGYNSKKDEIFCADFYKLSIFFESFETDLEQEIARRARNKEYFPETELWYLLDSVAAACSYLQTNQIPHKDIRPFNIFLTANGDYKISAGNSFQQSTEPTFYENFSRPESRAHNYSPELLRQVTLPLDKRTKFDQYRSDIFSLGLTIVEAGNLERPEVYDYERKEVREAAIHESLNKLRTRYSENLVRTVEAALRVDPEHRLDFNVLERERGVYRRSIREKARGPEAVNYSPVKTTGQQEHRTPGERVLRAGAPGHQEHIVPTYPGYQSDDIDARVREAVIRSEAVIKRSSPTKYANSNLDPYIQRYLRNDLSKDQSLLVAISPHLTSESKYTTTLTIEQPNYGRESQPLNFGQDVPESVKKSSYVEPAPATHHSQVNTYGQPGVHSSQVNAYGQPGVHSSQVNAYGQPGVHSSQVHAHTAYGQPAGASTSQYYGTTGGVVADYGQVATKLSQAHTYGTGHLATSGLGQNYGVTHQPTYIPAGNLGTSGLGHQAYNVTSIHHSSSHTPTHAGTVAGQQKDYSHEADELTRRIAERLNQSKQQF